MSPMDLANIQSMTSAAISPDGTKIAAIRTVPRKLFSENDGPDWTELYVLDTNDGSTRPFVTAGAPIADVEWLPDGSAISFLSQRAEEEHTSLYLIPEDGGEARLAVSLESGLNSYCWHPDGSRVAVIAARPPTEEDRLAEEKGFTQEVFEEDWHPFEVWIAELDGKTDPRPLKLAGSPLQIRWSPDGGRLAVSSAPRPLVDDLIMFQTIRIVSVETGETKATIEREGKLGRFEWSPDGRHLAMITAADLDDPSASTLAVVPASGRALRNLTVDYPISVTSFGWQDDNTLVFLADVGVRTELFKIDLKIGEPLPFGLFEDLEVYTSLSLSDDGSRAALIGDSRIHPDEVFVMDLAARTTPVRLTDVNPWLAEIRLAPQEVVRYISRDRVELEGLLIRPLDPEANGPAPLIMVVHGGPEGHRRDGWLSRYSAPAQVLAGRGYAVFFPNYRGSTGRGVAFSKLGQADAGGREFEDLIDAVDHLIDTGVADRDRIGVTGGSYGGYATAWLATRYSDRFSAGVMFVGLSNLISKFGTTDIPQEEVLVHAMGYPWERWRFYLERSPIFHARKSSTPLLIMGGTEDTRVNPTQSMELYRALRTIGKVPVRLVRYPGEGHGNKRAASRYDYQLRLVRWFDHYLKGPGGEPPPYRVDYQITDREN
jgi:dipeptidyl aminopeptidase/acylaminoacyl peptidase